MDIKNALVFENRTFIAINTFIGKTCINEETVLTVVKDTRVILVDEPTFALLTDEVFYNGIIEVKVLSKLLPNAPDYARGFIGIAFRINDTNNAFEGIYIRPTNGRCELQNRRNSSTQYFSYPDFKFDRLRLESLGKYESYADMGLNEWISLKIVVKNEHAELYLNHSIYPVLVINDLKHGPNKSGRIGLWVDIGTEGYFKDLEIRKL